MSWRRFFFRGRWDDERRRELESYIEIETDANIARGLSPDTARRAAYRKLGNPTLVREDIYRMNTVRLLETVWQDVRYGARLLRLNPAFTVVALLSLSLGVGANTAIFQLIDAVRLRPLPVEDPQQLVEVRLAELRERSGRFTGRRPMLTNALWEQIRDRQQVFASMAVWGGGAFDLSDGGESRYASTLFVSGGYFEMLGVRPAAGRLLAPSDDVKGCAAPQVVVSHAFAQREFNSLGVVGRKVRLEGQDYEIAGVTQPGFFGVDVGRTFDVAAPLCAEPRLRGAYSSLALPTGWFLAAVGRLKPGVTEEQATAHLQAMSAPIFRETLPPTYSAQEAKRYLGSRLAAFSARSGVSSIRRTYDTPLWALLGTTGLVLLIACANLANLMLARATAREREIAVRLAIGASRRRMVRQLMSESLLLALIGAFCGAVLAGWMSRFLISFLDTASNHVYVPLSLDWRVFGFAGGLAVTTCVLFGLAPALRATHAAPVAAMKTGSRSVTDSRERFGLRRGLVIVQVALSLVLMVGALLFIRSLTNLRSTDLGFNPDRLLVVGLDLRRAPVPQERRIAQYRDIRERLQRAPNVAAAAEVVIVPVSGSGWNNNILIDGKVQETFPNFNRVSPGYFAAMQTPILAGRDFADSDAIGAAEVAIVNESFARKFFGSPNVIGRTFQVEEPVGSPRPHYQIVGVVKDTKYSDLRGDVGPIGYLAAGQEPDPGPSIQLMVRARGSLATARDDVRQTIGQFNPGIGMQLDTMDMQIREMLMPERLMATLSAFFGGLAALIAMVGLYGVMSYMVTRRRGEIGIRMALGADRVTVVRMVMGESAILVALGTVVGLALSVLAARWVSTLLFGLRPGDPLTLCLSAAALALVAACASYLPARRAARVSPMLALRE
jgi:putative ABC transport system permease protein